MTDHPKEPITEAEMNADTDKDHQMDEQSVAAAVRLARKIEQHEAFIGLLQSGQLVAHLNAEGEDVFFAKEFDPAPATEMIRLPYERKPCTNHRKEETMTVPEEDAAVLAATGIGLQKLIQVALACPSQSQEQSAAIWGELSAKVKAITGLTLENHLALAPHGCNTMPQLNDSEKAALPLVVRQWQAELEGRAL